MKNTKKLIFITTLLLLGFSCREDDFDVLPRETQEGLNTFGCIIDGEILVPRDGVGGIGGFPSNGLKLFYYPFDSTYYWQDSSLEIVAGLSSRYWHMSLFLDCFNGVGIYELSSRSTIRCRSYSEIIKSRKNDIRQLFHSYEHSGSVFISRFDTINKIVSGTFSFKAYDSEDSTDPEIIEIELGVFDINWGTLNCGKNPWNPPCPE